MSVCELRDVKGLYKKAREGSIQGFTGVTQAYEAPENPDLIVSTETCSIRESTEKLIDLLKHEKIVPATIRDDEKMDQIPELFAEPSKLAALHEEAKTLPQLNITTVEMQWLQVLSEGWAYPLKGFMREHQYLQALHFNCISTDDKDAMRYNQSVPIVLSVTDADHQRLVG